MKPPTRPASDPAAQLEWFAYGITLLGGVEAASRRTGLGSSSLRQFRNGTRALHVGVMEIICRAAVEYAGELRAFDRAFNPAFSSNLTPRQRQAPPHGNARRAAPGAR